MPSCRRQTSSATSRAKAISCVAISIVMPSALSSLIAASTSPTSSGSSALVTSSSSSARGRVGERAGDRDALLLAAGEPVGVLVLAPGEPEAREQLARVRLGLGAALAVSPHRREHHVLERGSGAGRG